MIGDRLKTEILRYDNLGRGIAKVDNMIVFVNDSFIGEMVEIEIKQVKKNYMEATLVNIIKKSPYRRISPCKYSDSCGGCNLINLDFDKQVKEKQDKIKEMFTRNFSYSITINKILSNDKEFNYRNKIVLHGDNKEIGLYRNKTNEIVPINRCLLVSDIINSMITLVNKIKDNEKINIDEITIRCNKKGNVLVNILGKCNKKILKDTFLGIDTLVLNDNLLIGDGCYIEEELFGYNFKVSANSFFQVNLDMVEFLYKEVIRHIKDNNYNRVLDLYCGTGTLSLLVSRYANEVIGIETSISAVLDANENKKVNGVDNVEFICGKVEDYIDKFEEVELIIVDPPRSGLDSKTIENIIRIKPNNIVYVSCNPVTLIRDLKALDDEYVIKEVTTVDMFPNTYHVECVILLSLKKCKNVVN